jgi:hypothetical protein
MVRDSAGGVFLDEWLRREFYKVANGVAFS